MNLQKPKTLKQKNKNESRNEGPSTSRIAYSFRSAAQFSNLIGESVEITSD